MLTGRLVAAFEAGRLFNRLAFHGVQAPFRAVGGSSHDFWFHTLAGRLGVAAGRLAPDLASTGLDEDILDAIDSARSSYLHPDHPDELWSAEDDVVTQRDRERRIERFLEPVWESLYKVRQLIMSRLGDERLRRALRLGERLDEAVAPGRIGRRLYDPDGDYNTQLSNVDWWPGDLPPEPGCLEDVRLRAAELGLPPAYLDRLDVREEAITESGMERMADAIREGLRIVAEPGGESAHRPRIVVDLALSTVDLDGVRWRVDELGAQYLQVLLDAKGEWMSREEARRARPELEHEQHLERIRDALPEPICKAIETINRHGSRIRREYLGRPSH